MTTKMEVFMAVIATITLVVAVIQLVIMFPAAQTKRAPDKISWRARRTLENGTVLWLFVVFFTGLYHFMYRVAEPTNADIANFGVCVFAGSGAYALVIARAVLKKTAAKHRELQVKIDDLESRWTKAIQMHSDR